jgi:hypothetical protein
MKRKFCEARFSAPTRPRVGPGSLPPFPPASRRVARVPYHPASTPQFRFDPRRDGLRRPVLRRCGPFRVNQRRRVPLRSSRLGLSLHAGEREHRRAPPQRSRCPGRRCTVFSTRREVREPDAVCDSVVAQCLCVRSSELAC